MYLSKGIRILLQQARNIGCHLTIEGVEFINASGETLRFIDGTKIPGSSAIAEEFHFLAKKKWDKEFDRTGRFRHLVCDGDAFSIGGQSFLEYKRENKPLIIVRSEGIAQLLGKPTITAQFFTKLTADKNIWTIYGWEMGIPYRMR